MKKLKRCPFCGRKADLRYTSEDFSYIVCANDGCYVRTDGHLNEESAIKSWNRRMHCDPTISCNTCKYEACGMHEEPCCDCVRVKGYDEFWEPKDEG